MTLHTLYNPFTQNLDLVESGGSSALMTLTGNTGGAISAVAGNIDIIGTGSLSFAGTAGTLTLTDSGTSAITIDLHVSAQGNNATGTGSLSRPYLTAAKAFDVAAAGSPTITKNYSIYLHGIVTEAVATPPQITPFTHLIGDGSRHNLNSNVMVLRSTWSAVTNAPFEFRNIDYAGQTIVLDTTSFADTNTRLFYWYNCKFVENTAIAGATLDLAAPLNTTFHKFFDCIGNDPVSGASAQLNITVGGAYYASGGSFPRLNVSSTNSLTITTVSVLGVVLADAFNADATAGTSIMLSISGSDAATNLTQALLIGDVAGVTLIQDSEGINRNAISFSGLGGIMYKSWAQLMQADFQGFPVNYVPATPPTGFDRSIEQFFEGIDTGLHIISVDYHVSAQGNNSTGTGAITNPFLTAQKAMSVITTAADYSASKNYNIYLHGVVTESTNLGIVPFCHLIGDGSLHSLGGHSIIFAATIWGASNQFFTFQNIDYTGQALSLAAAGFANNVRYIKFQNCIGGTFAFTAPSTATVYVFQNDLTTNPFLGGNGTLTGNGGAYMFTGASNFDTVTLTNSNGQTNGAFESNILPRIISCNSNGSGQLSTYIFASDSQINGTGVTMNASANSCVLFTDTSIPNASITLLNGATVTLSTQAQMLLPGFTPTNYTPSTATTGYPTSVKNHLQGIDSALGTVVTSQYDPGFINKMPLTRTGATTVSIGIGKATDSANSYNFSVGSPITLTITSSGAGGLDTGSYATDTWYYVYVIAKADNTTSGVFSTNGTSPTLPSGYTKFRLIGTCRSATVGTVIKFFYQTGNSNARTYYWDDEDTSQQVLDNGNAVIGAPGTVDCRPVMSPLSQEGQLQYDYVPFNASNAFNISSPDDSDLAMTTTTGQVMGQVQSGVVPIWANSTQQISYFVSSTSDSLDLQGVSYVEYV